jgi:phage protein D
MAVTTPQPPPYKEGGGVTTPQPQFKLVYGQKDVTTELSPFILSITYTDVLAGESDELEVNIEDRDQRWKNGWFPGKGDSLALSIGYHGSPLAAIGGFSIDEIEFNGTPDTVSIRALAAGVAAALRTINTTAYETKTLKTIAEEIAGKHGLVLIGAGSNTGKSYARITQNKETDLAFLNRLGAAEGVIFSIKNGALVWHDQAELDAAKVITVINRSAMTSFTFRAKTATTYKACQVSYHDPKTKSLKTYTDAAAGVPSGDTLKIVERCESLEQATAKAKAALRDNNGKQVEGSILLYGNEKLRAGCNIEVSGLGLLDGVYQILKAVHSMERAGGYITSLELSTTTAQNKNLKNLRNDARVTR